MSDYNPKSPLQINEETWQLFVAFCNSHKHILMGHKNTYEIIFFERLEKLQAENKPLCEARELVKGLVEALNDINNHIDNERYARATFAIDMALKDNSEAIERLTKEDA